jgi:carbon-monoxide dehydrogenase small subunit
MEIEFKLNGSEVSITADPTRRLIDILRDDLNLTGTKEGCGEGECGACAVLIDGELVNSCLTAAMFIKGKEVMTIEGFSTNERFMAIKEGFDKAGSVQCGFCTPGVVLAAEALLRKNPHPTRDEAVEAIEGNLCRCTGYSMIVDGILEASKAGEGLW